MSKPPNVTLRPPFLHARLRAMDIDELPSSPVSMLGSSCCQQRDRRLGTSETYSPLFFFVKPFLSPPFLEGGHEVRLLWERLRPAGQFS